MSNTEKLYEVNVTAIGADVAAFMEDKMIILFNEGVPPELEDISVRHSGGELTDELRVGDVIQFDDAAYAITAIGVEASPNLKKLGHVTLNFDGNTEPTLPGTIHLEAKKLPSLEVGSVIHIKRP